MRRSRGNANGDVGGPANGPAKYVIIGAGIHGLSTARHLASELRASGRGGRDILIIDKTGIGGERRASRAASSATTTSGPPCAN